MRLRYLLVPGCAAVMAGALTLTAGTATVASPARAGHVAYSARFVSAASAALASYLRHRHPQALLAGHVQAGRAGVTTVPSFNWSGYGDGAKTTAAGTFTKVSGSWTAPGVTCRAEDQLTVDWVGLDGLFSNSVEQAGTMAWCFQHKPIYFTWWEMFPTGSGLIEVGKTLRPGDKISASVTRSGTAFKLKLTDSTTKANSFATTQTCPASKCLASSAEWIAERPAFGIGIAPLVHFNAFKITNGTEVASGKSGTIGSFSSVNEIQMVDATNTYHLSTVSALAGGKSFSATWRNSY